MCHKFFKCLSTNSYKMVSVSVPLLPIAINTKNFTAHIRLYSRYNMYLLEEGNKLFTFFAATYYLHKLHFSFWTSCVSHHSWASARGHTPLMGVVVFGTRPLRNVNQSTHSFDAVCGWIRLFFSLSFLSRCAAHQTVHFSIIVYWKCALFGVFGLHSRMNGKWTEWIVNGNYPTEEWIADCVSHV